MSITSSAEVDALLLQVLLDPEGRADPYPLYSQMREVAPVTRSVMGALLVNGHEESLSVLRNPQLGRGMGLEQQATGTLLNGPIEGRGEFFELSSQNMLLADPPDHTRLRQLVSRAFTPKHIELLRPAVHSLVDQLLDDMAAAGEVDFMAAFALPLPMAVIGELVGVPESDRTTLQPLVRAVAKGIEPIITEEETLESIAAIDQLGEYFGHLLDERRGSPRDDLMSGLALAHENDDRLTDYEVCSTAILLFAAGFETTTNLLGNGLLALLRHPDQLERWRHDPALAPTGVDELLRWDSPVQLNLRTALEPTEYLGEPLNVGDRLIVLQGAANRDPRRFENADVLDVGRTDNQPVSFGWGIHHCIGAGLARMEGEIALTSLLQRFSRIDLETDEPEWRPSFTLRGLLSLPISLAA